MRLLLTLILTHCFGCILTDDFGDEYESRKLKNFKSSGRELKINSTMVAIYLASKRERNRGKLKDLVPMFHEKHGKHRRKLLNYLDRNLCKVVMKNQQFPEMRLENGRSENLQPRKNRRYASTKMDDEADNNAESDVWDDWGNWSTCSATCGDGHQVRWRHCLSNACIKGFKKAQIKTCRLKNCDKNLLHWLGIKS